MDVRTLAALAAVALTPGPAVAHGGGPPPNPEPGRTAASGVYTDAQAERGRAVYREHCSYCHHDDLLGGEDLEVIPPALVGLDFSERWYGKSAGELLRGVAATMPWRTAPLTAQLYADVVSYMLKENGYPAGNVELPPESSEVDDVLITEAR